MNYNRIHRHFGVNPDSGLIQDRKSTFIKLSNYSRPALVYPKTMLHEVHCGDAAIPCNYIVVETLRKPRSLDGYVVCIER